MRSRRVARRIAAGVDDVAFIDTLITKISAEASVDPLRIYACVMEASA